MYGECWYWENVQEGHVWSEACIVLKHTHIIGGSIGSEKL